MINKIECKAELLAVEFVLENKTKIIIVTCYKVGTSGILITLMKFFLQLELWYEKKSVRKLIMVGDLNLKGINWEDSIGKSNIDSFLLNGFVECGLIQCVKNANHNKGGILDVCTNFFSKLLIKFKGP